MVKTADDAKEGFKDGKIASLRVLGCGFLSQEYYVTVAGSASDKNSNEDSRTFDGVFSCAWKSTKSCGMLWMQASKAQKWILPQTTIS